MSRDGGPRAVQLGSAPAMTRERAGSRCVGSGVRRLRRTSRSVHQSHLTPAPRVRAIVARSDSGHGEARQDRLHGSTSMIELLVEGLRRPGGLPRKIPGFASPPHDGFALDGGPSRSGLRFNVPNLAGHRSRRQYAGSTASDLYSGVSASTHRTSGSVRPARAGRDAAVARVVKGPRPCIAATTAMAAPTPIRASPTLKTLASGIQVGIAKMSVSGPSTTPSTRRLFE